MGQSDDPYRSYAEAVRASAEVDPMPTVRALAENAHLAPEEIVHHVLVQWATSYAEAHLAIGPLVLRQLKEASDAGDLEKVRGIVNWLLSE